VLRVHTAVHVRVCTRRVFGERLRVQINRRKGRFHVAQHQCPTLAHLHVNHVIQLHIRLILIAECVAGDHSGIQCVGTANALIRMHCLPSSSLLPLEAIEHLALGLQQRGDCRRQVRERQT
jgi:hypothetical protein